MTDMRNRDTRRKTLILPVDIKSREMDARLLHAVVALDAGWRVIIGSKTLINRNLWRLPRGVYLFSTLAPGRLRIARCLRAMGFASQGWDEEGLIYGDRDIYLQERVSPDTMALIDQIFAWGEAHAEDLSIPARQAGKTVEVAGNPRLDLLRPELRGLHEPEARRIRATHGDFILITTNLSWANPHVLPKEQQDLHVPAQPADDRREGARSYLQYQKRMLTAFRSAIPHLARTFPDTRIILRPHPVENMESWKELLSPFPNVEVIREGAVIPWILASRILIHSNSTTGLEARLLGGCPVAFVPFNSPRHESPLPNGVSLIARSEEELSSLIARILSGNPPDSSAQDAFLKRYIHQTNDLQARYFVKRAEELLNNNDIAISGYASRFYLLMRHAQKMIRRNSARDIHRRNIFPDTSPDEVLKCANFLADCIKADCRGRIQIHEIGRNIYSLALISKYQ